MQVWPKNDAMRKLLKHPSNNVHFREEGSMEWPDDQFTYRRLEDGDVLREEPNPKIFIGHPPEIDHKEKHAKSHK